MNDFFEFEGFTDELLISKKQQFSNFAKTPLTAGFEAVGKGFEMGGKIAEASATKKEAEAKIVEIGGKRQAQLNDCETNKAYKKFLDAKYRRNRIKDCQNEVKKRLDAEENEQRDIVRRMTAIEEKKIESDFQKSKSLTEETKSSKKLNVIGGLVGLTLILGTIIFIRLKRN